MDEPKQPDAIGNWKRLGRPSPPPHEYKAQLVLGYAFNHGLRTFVETGTGTGEMVTSVAHGFEQMHSVELDMNLHEDAAQRYGTLSNFALAWGDAAVFLADLLPLEEPALFWLDAHGPNTCALLEELAVLAAADIGASVILVDDVRLMTWTRNGWPDIDDVLGLVAKLWPDRRAVVEDDVLRITPAADRKK